VTVVLSTYNHERYIDEALDSLGAQTSREFEVVAIDDGSTDATVATLERRLGDLPVPARLIVNERNLGLCATKNRALTACDQQFVCFFAGDDVYEPQKIEHQLAFMRSSDEQVAAMFADAWVMTDAGRPIHRWFDGRRPVRDGAIFDAILDTNFIPAPTVMVRRAVIEDVGGFDTNLYIDDRDMWLRILDRGYELRFLDECVIRYRLSPEGISRNPAYAARRMDGRARTIMKWHGRAPHTDALIRRRAWGFAMWAVALDPDLGRPLLRDVYAMAPGPARHLALRALDLPGGPQVLGRALTLRDARDQEHGARAGRGDQR
jgi:glycosyltransferase involved in cell wall biosynthesis